MDDTCHNSGFHHIHKEIMGNATCVKQPGASYTPSQVPWTPVQLNGVNLGLGVPTGF